MTFYDELKVLCKKYGLYCGVYARSVDEDNLEKHQVFVELLTRMNQTRTISG